MNLHNADPLQKVETELKRLQDTTGKFTQPVLKRYPLLFTFLLTFSVAAILHGFEIWTDQIPLFQKNPLLLMGIGIFILIATGRLYKTLDRFDR